MKRYILFDHDGVLVDTEHWYYTANRRALTEYGIALEPDDYQRLMVAGRSCWDIARDAGLAEQTVQEGLKRRDQYYRCYLEQEDIRIVGVEESLAELADRYRMAIVTTSKRADFEVIHRDTAITRKMEFVLTREDYVRAKPHPEPFLMALQRFGAKPHEVIVIEDSARGLHAAMAAGLDCLIVFNEFTQGHDFTGAVGHVERFDELPKVLEAMNSQARHPV